MKIVIIDERKGDVLRQDALNHRNNCDAVLTIEADGNVTVISDAKKFKDLEAHFFDAVHRDVISAEKSKKAHAEREAKRDNTPAESPLTKAARVWDDEHSGSSGTVNLNG